MSAKYLKKERILLVEDNVAVAETITRMLTGCHVVHASRFREADELLDECWSLVLLDVHLGKARYGGLQLLEKCNDADEVIVLSARVDSLIREAAATVGATCVDKHDGLEKLLTEISVRRGKSIEERDARFFGLTRRCPRELAWALSTIAEEHSLQTRHLQVLLLEVHMVSMSQAAKELGVTQRTLRNYRDEIRSLTGASARDIAFRAMWLAFEDARAS